MEADPFDIVFILAVGDERWSASVLAPHVKKVACHSGKEARTLCAPEIIYFHRLFRSQDTNPFVEDFQLI